MFSGSVVSGSPKKWRMGPRNPWSPAPLGAPGVDICRGSQRRWPAGRDRGGERNEEANSRTGGTHWDRSGQNQSATGGAAVNLVRAERAESGLDACCARKRRQQQAHNPRCVQAHSHSSHSTMFRRPQAPPPSPCLGLTSTTKRVNCTTLFWGVTTHEPTPAGRGLGNLKVPRWTQPEGACGHG